MARKMEKILKSYNAASFKATIMTVWIESGINIAYSNGKIASVVFDKESVIFYTDSIMKKLKIINQFFFYK